MNAPEASPRLDLRARRRRVLARAGALATDTLLLAYAAWCANFLQIHAAGPVSRSGWLGRAAGFLGERPWLYLLAPLLAVLWEASGRSLGQRAHGLLVVDGVAGAAAPPDRRLFRALLAGLQGVLALVPATLGVLTWRAGGDGGFHLFLSLLMAGVFLLAGLFDPWGRGLVDRLASTNTVRRPRPETVEPRPWWRRLTPWTVIVLLVLTFLVGAVLTEFDPLRIVTGAKKTGYLWGRLLRPDWTITTTVIEKMVETVFLALVASTLALPFAFVLSFLGARNLMRTTTAGRVVYVLTRVFMNVTRSIEPLVWAIIFTLWVGIGPFAGMLALFIHSVAALGKLYSEAIEAIDPGPMDAIRATGASALQTLRYGVVPQVVPPFLSFTVYRWDINVRMATILGLVGGGGIGDLLINYQQLGAWSKVGTIIVFITLVVWMMDWVSSKARERLT
ncbi:MAG: phosphonate ABC transporter, permease protein PhnE [Planctomycetota bacterium]